jgi:hypothetical protein
LQEDARTTAWWRCLIGIAVLNIVLWVLTYVSVKPDGPYQVWQVRLSGVFAIVCAYRSWLPRIDLERYCLVDSPASSIFLGRSAATLAEVGFAAQMALWLQRVGQLAGLPLVCHFSYAVVPLLALAQVFCWASVITLNHLGHAIEESIWAGTMAGVVICLATAYPSVTGVPRLFVAAGVLCTAGYVLFMVVIDVPMYVRRWRRGRARGEAYLSFRAGLADALMRRVVTQAWAIWRPEVAWLTGYFSFAVWVSLAFVHLPGR